MEGYFDSIPHSELMQCVTRRISDGKMLHLVDRTNELYSGHAILRDGSA